VRMTPSLLDAATRESFLGRIRALPADAQPRFGTLTAGRMLCHVLDGLKIAFGEVRPEPVRGPLKNALGKWFVIWSPIPWPKGKIKAPPAFFSTPPGPELEADRVRLLEYVRRFERPGEISWGTSPFLGKLDAREWAALNARHLEHHLSQFGV
jgi:hypothetical protein